MREMLAQQHKIVRKPRTEWKQRCADWRNRYPLVLPEHKVPGRVSVYNFAEVMSNELKQSEYIVSGSSARASSSSYSPSGSRKTSVSFTPPRSARWASALLRPSALAFGRGRPSYRVRRRRWRLPVRALWSWKR